MDVLSDVLSWLRVEGTLSRRSELLAPWGIAYARHDAFSFMVVETGSCFLMRAGQEPMALEKGDLVMASPGGQTSMADHPDTPLVPYAEVLETCAQPQTERYALHRDAYPTLRYGGGGRMTTIRGWGLRFEGHEEHPLLALLPPLIRLSYEQRLALPRLESTLRFLLYETQHKGDGSEMMSVRLVDLLFVQVIRAWFQEQPEGAGGWLGALRDPSVGHALRLVHQYPADAWTVQSLAKAVGMSRSGFSARFLSLVGAPPLKYVTQVRMNLAALALTSEAGTSMGELAHRVGYDSESSFGRAFKRYFGMSPGAFRRSRTDRGAP